MTILASQENSFGEIAGILMRSHALPPGTDARDSAYRDAVTRDILWISRFALDADYTAFKSERELVQRMLTGFFDFRQPSLSHLDVYLGHWRSGAGEVRLLQKYPVLQTLKKRCSTQHEQYRREIAQHFFADHPPLAREFGLPEVDFMLKGIDIGLGDAHQHGKSTAMLTLGHGMKIVYKPRSGGIDLAFKGLIDALNARIPGLALQTFSVVDKGSYSWAEYVAHAPCYSQAAIGRYYRRCGALACIVYGLMGTDLHFENIIASGEHPVLIDLECLFSSMLGESYDVMSTGLIPCLLYQRGRATKLDISGMGACGSQLSGSDVWDWCGDGDAIGLVKKPSVFTAKNNQPVLDGVHISPENHLDEILAGFTLVYNWLKENKAELSAENGLLAGFRNKTIRVLVRATDVYRSIIDTSLTPSSLASRKLRHEAIVEALQAHDGLLRDTGSLFLSNEMKETLLLREALALERLDTPYLLANTSRLELTESGKPVGAEFFKTTPYEFVVDRINSLTPENLILQTALIRQAFAKRYATPLLLPAPTTGKSQTDCVVSREIENIASVIDASQRTAATAKKSAAATFDHIGGMIQCVSVESLFCGDLGACLFLSAVDRSTGSDRYMTVVDAKLRSAIDSASLLYSTGAGAVTNLSYSTGLAGLIFTLMRADPVKYEAAACQLSRSITAEAVHGDRNLDFMAGGAGCLLVLTELYRRTKAADVLKTAEIVGEHLLASRRIDPHSGYRAWTPERFKGPQTGFSHGAAGISLALLQMYAANGNSAYLDAFHEAVSFENSYFERDIRNWRDLRRTGTQFQTAWCHGAPGIGLSRVHAFRILGDERLLDDVRAAVTATRRFFPGTETHYCCGMAGCLDFLIEAGRVLDDANLLAYVDEQIERTIGDAGSGGLVRSIALDCGDKEDLSLFCGAAGIGYVFLRSRDKTIPGMIPGAS